MSWSSFSDQVESAVDAQFGEQIQILPYRSSGYLGDPEPDPSRPILTGVGYVVGRSTFLRNIGSTTFHQRRAEADMLLQVRDKYVGATRQKDRVRLLGRSNKVMEVSYLEIGTNGRTVLHLLNLP